MTICPCCGFNLNKHISEGCENCGASPVGPPLAAPDQQLPFYGYSTIAAGLGIIFLLSFLIDFILTLNERIWFLHMGIWDIVAAAQTAAWHFKWVAIPLSIISIWIGIRACSLIRREPNRFIGRRAAYVGLASSTVTTILIALFIGITIPDRLRQRRLAIEAAENSIYYSAIRMLHQYHTRYGTYPANIEDLKRLQDTDNSIAIVLNKLKQTNYTPTSVQASSRPIKQSRALRPPRLVRVSSTLSELPPATNTDTPNGETLSFTNYELVWPGADNILGTDDDRMVRDGTIVETEVKTETLNKE